MLVRRGVWVAGIIAQACSFTPGMLPSEAGISDDADFTVGWSMPTKIAEIEHPMGNDDPSLTADLLEIYFGSSRPGGMGAEDIWVAKRASVDDPFGTPMPVVELNSPMSETTIKVTGGGRSIYFTSDRAGATGGLDIFMSTRAELDQPWTNPILVVELSSANNDYGAAAQTDQLRVVLCTGGAPAQEALYTSTRTSTAVPWSAPAKIDELDETGYSDCDPFEPRSGVLYYASNFRPGDGTFDVYRASRSSSSSPYGNRTGITGINAPGVNDRDPWISADERTMVFASDRDRVTTQIYISTRR